MRSAILRSLAVAAVSVNLAALVSAQPTPGVADYYVKWTLDADGGGDWVLVNPGFWTDEVSGHLAVHVSGAARVDMDLPLAAPFEVSGTWDSLQEDVFTYTCTGNPVTVATTHNLWTLSSAASLPRTDFLIALGNGPGGNIVVLDPFPALPALPAGSSIQITASGADCSGPVDTQQEIDNPNVGFPIFSTPGDIPSAGPDNKYFSGGADTTLFLDPSNQVGVVFHWHVEVTDITACGGVTTTFYRDADGDGYGDSGNTIQACSATPGYVADGGDCADDDAHVHPGAIEICDNGIDDDCDGVIDGEVQTLYRDADGDGFGDPSNHHEACQPEAGYVLDGSDCDDTDADRYPGAPELCDLKDNDCDGQTDEGNPGGNEFCDTGLPGACSVGITSCVGGSIVCLQINTPSPEVCDGLDNDCDGEIDEGGVCGGPVLTALGPAKVWIGLVRNEDAGIRFDLQAKVFLNNVEVGSGQLDSVAGGGRTFANALLHQIPLTLTAPVPVASGDKLKIRLFVRNACSGSTEVNGAARLWYNGQPIDSGRSRDAGSRFNVTIDGLSRDEFLRRNFVLRVVPGNNRESEDQPTRGQCGPFRAFGTWKVTLP